MNSTKVYGKILLKLLSSILLSLPSLFFLFVFDCTDLVLTESLVMAFSAHSNQYHTFKTGTWRIKVQISLRIRLIRNFARQYEV